MSDPDIAPGTVGTGAAFADRYGPWALVAGASEGVGAAYARALAERGVNVVLLSRRQAALDALAAAIRADTRASTPGPSRWTSPTTTPWRRSWRPPPGSTSGR
jgi:NAD(P)-dependent dehydrogenase (short-subunit alcohol dehydrogenase family)